MSVTWSKGNWSYFPARRQVWMYSTPEDGEGVAIKPVMLDIVDKWFVTSDGRVTADGTPNSRGRSVSFGGKIRPIGDLRRNPSPEDVIEDFSKHAVLNTAFYVEQSRSLAPEYRVNQLLSYMEKLVKEWYELIVSLGFTPDLRFGEVPDQPSTYSDYAVLLRDRWSGIGKRDIDPAMLHSILTKLDYFDEKQTAYFAPIRHMYSMTNLYREWEAATSPQLVSEVAYHMLEEEHGVATASSPAPSYRRSYGWSSSGLLLPGVTAAQVGSAVPISSPYDSSS